MRAIVAVEHAMVVVAWNLLVYDDFYRDPGPDYYTARQPPSNQPTPNPRIPSHPRTTHPSRIAQDNNQSPTAVTPFSC